MGGPTSESSAMPAQSGKHGGFRLDRNELAGAFGDIGTDLPLLVGMILVSGASGAQIFLVFGALQILSSLIYRLPMPVQPLKAVAALVIAQAIPAEIIYGAGLAIGVTMLLLTLSGTLEVIARIIPKAVIRGVQLGLGFQLALIAVNRYMPAEGAAGLLLAGAGVLITLALLGNRRWPPALFVIALGMAYALYFHTPASAGMGIGPPPTPALSMPSLEAIGVGFLLLALPQIPLSLGNSILATQQTVADLFPERAITVRRIGFTYSLMNLLAPVLQGFPVCHGSGGMAGHYAFGGRTGGSVLIYGGIFVLGGLLLLTGQAHFFWLFPLPILGVLLLFEGLALVRLTRDQLGDPIGVAVALGVGITAVALPYGFLVGMCGGTLAHGALVYWAQRRAGASAA